MGKTTSFTLPTQRVTFSTGWVYPIWYSLGGFEPSDILLDGLNWNPLSSITQPFLSFFFSFQIWTVQTHGEQLRYASENYVVLARHLNFFPTQHSDRGSSVFIELQVNNRTTDSDHPPMGASESTLSTSQVTNPLPLQLSTICSDSQFVFVNFFLAFLCTRRDRTTRLPPYLSDSKA